MISIKPVKKPVEKKYSTATVAFAIGKSESSVAGYFNNKRITTKGGLTIQQIAELATAKTRGNIIDWEGVKEIRSELAENYGLEIVEE